MSDPDQEEIRRKRLARLGASPTSSSSQGASQQGAHMSETTDGARSTRETPTKSRSNSGEARDPAFHQAVKSDMTSPTVSEDISMQTIEEGKESGIAMAQTLFITIIYDLRSSFNQISNFRYHKKL